MDRKKTRRKRKEDAHAEAEHGGRRHPALERQTECGEYVYAHKAAKAALAFDPFNSSLNMHLTILLYQQSGAGTANAFYTGIKRHLTEAHIQRIKQTCPNMII